MTYIHYHVENIAQKTESGALGWDGGELEGRFKRDRIYVST